MATPRTWRNPANFFKLCLAAALAVGAAPLLAQGAYPNKPIRLIVTFPPGGSSDLLARAIVPKLSERLGQPIVVDNRPGAGGNIGLELLTKAPPDGYTIAVGAAGGLAVNVSLYAHMPFDPIKDFAPVSMLAMIPFALIGNPSLPAAALPDLLAMAKASPGKLAVGHGGNGTAMHLSAELFEQMAAVDLTAVAYKGSGPAATDTVGGQVPLAMVDLASALPYLKAKRLRAYGVTSAQRISSAPDLPTLSEAGLPGYESVGWFGVVAPAGTPAPIVARLNAEIVAVINSPEIRAQFESVGAEPLPSTQEEFASLIRSEIAKWARVIKVANVKVE